MAVTPATRSVKEYKGKSVFFIMNDRLYRLVDKDPVADKIMAYDFTDHKNKVFRLSEYKKYSKKAYNLTEALRIVGRSYYYGRRTLAEYMPHLGHLATYEPDKLDDPTTWRRYYYSKDDVLAMHEFFANIDPRGEGLHRKARGRRNFPKPKNKLVKRTDMPTREEVLMKLNSTEVYYIKDENGEFIPVFKPGW